jgi:transcriptional regulator with XRE-family HTH domain
MTSRDSKSLRAVLAKNIRALRKERGLSQESLADEAELHRTYIGSVERGERNISIDSIEKIAKALRVSGARLLSDGGK